MTHPATYPPTLDPPVNSPAPAAPVSAPERRVGAPAAPGRGQTAGMRDVLTEDQSPATRVAMAGATPETAGATPAAQEAAPAAGTPTPPAPRKGGRGRPGAADAPLSTAGATGQAAPATEAAPPATGRGAVLVGRALMVVAAIGMPLVGVIGFAASYSTLERFAADNGFSTTFAPWFPIGVDVSIVALLAMDLVMVRRGMPWPLLRFAAHAMTLVTVLLNASDGISEDVSVWSGLWADPLWAVSHAAMPGLFVLGVEAARRLLMHAARIEEGTETDRIPVHRWLLAPARTGRLYRRMRLAAVRSYPEMVERERALAGYRVWLTQELGGDLSKATEVQMLPITMARHGYTVEEALALPAKWEAEAAKREAEEAARKAEDEATAAERAAELEIKKLESVARVESARHRVAAQTGTVAAESEAVTAQAQAQAETAKARAELTRRAAERQAETEAQAMESEEAATARLRGAEADRRAAAAEEEATRLRLVAVRQAEEAERREAEAERREAERAAARRRTREDDAAAAAAERKAAEDRAAAARAEAAAEAAEDYIRLTPRERSVRRVARMLLAAHPAGTSPAAIDIKAVPLSVIEERLGVAQTTAGDIRKEAKALIDGGYQPHPAEETYEN